MSEQITRKEFLKVAGLGLGTAAVLTGCGPASRYVTRRPYSDMPEYTLPGKSTFFATTCGECPAGCGLVVRTMEGRAHKVEGNPNHPVNFGKTCSRGQTTLQGLYNPDRIREPGKQSSRGSGQFTSVEWDAAVEVVQAALQANQPGEIAFLLGLAPDHLADLVKMIAAALGEAKILRYGSLSEFEARVTLQQAAHKAFGQARLPVFDLENAGMVLSFGANFLETWLSPVSFSRQYGTMRQGNAERRGYLVHFEPHMSLTAANADEWFPIVPGSEAFLAQGLARLIAEARTGNTPTALVSVMIDEVSRATGVAEAELKRVAKLFVNSDAPLAIPGGAALGQTDGLAAAEAVLAINTYVGNLGQPGGVFFMPDTPVYSDLPQQPAALADIASLVDQMNSGQIKVLFVHGVNPVYDIPKALGFQEALTKVPTVISFASFPDETAQQSDYVFPDHTALEAWGYQKVQVGSDRVVISGQQPVVVPLYNTRATADVFLAAVQAVGGALAEAVPYKDEVDFLQKSLAGLIGKGGAYTAPTAEAFQMLFQQYGGWWQQSAGLEKPAAQDGFLQALSQVSPQFAGDPAQYPLYLLPFPSPVLGEGSGANRPWLQETPDPMTTVMWNSWVEIHPDTARELGVKSDDVVKITSPAGEVEAVVYEYPAIQPDVIAIPLGQGHTALGRYAQGRGVNVLDLLVNQQNESGNLAFAATRVKVTPTGKTQRLARFESREGIYGKKAEGA